MKHIGALILSLIVLSMPVALHAQGQTLSASPIPDQVENRFCYYAGLAYSRNSYIVVTGSNTVTATSNEVQEKLLECVASDDGSFRWIGRSKIQNDR